jgi:hypothetical protein
MVADQPGDGRTFARIEIGNFDAAYPELLHAMNFSLCDWL